MWSVRWVFSDSDCEFVEPQTFSLSNKREASVALECETVMSIERPPVKSCARSGQKQAHAAKFAPECMQSRAPPPPEGTPVQSRPTWPGPPKKPPAEEEAMEVEDYNLPWTARERVVLDKKERYLKKSESIKVAVSELEHFLLGPQDADISITSFDEGGDGKFVLLDTPRGKRAGRGVETADAARFAEAAREVRRCEAANCNLKEGSTARTVVYAARPFARDTKKGDNIEN